MGETEETREFVTECMMQKERISVIVPVYNVKNYVERCLQSILRQSYDNLEIFVVDDGSTDGSGDLCERMARQDSRIICIHKENGGLSSARNAALDRMTGKYVVFVDSDDYIPKESIAKMYGLMVRYDADLVSGERECVYDDTCAEKDNGDGTETVWNSEEAVKAGLCNHFRSAVWGRLFRAELFRTIRFPEGLYYEDLAVIYDILLQTKTVVNINKTTYYYMIREGSIMTERFSPKQLVEMDIVDRAMESVVRAYPKYEKLTRARRVYSYFIVLYRVLCSAEGKADKELRRSIGNRIKTVSKGLLFEREVPKGTRLKLFVYRFGERPYAFCQKIRDRKNPEIVPKKNKKD